MMETIPLPTSLDFPVHGVHYHVRLAGAGRPLLLLHGFTGSSASWEPFAATLGSTKRLIAVDLLGHGGTDAPPNPDRYRVEPAARDLLALLDALGVHEYDLLGYSMGGRLALHLALAAPERLRALVLESATPGIETPYLRAARVHADEALATVIEEDGIERFVARWEAQPLFAGLAALPEEARARLHAQRLQNTARGLANSLRGMGAGVPPPLQHRLPELEMPVLLIVGALDGKFRSIAEEMSTRLPRGRTVVVQDAGHAVHLEQPAAFESAVLRFLSESEQDRNVFPRPIAANITDRE